MAEIPEIALADARIGAARLLLAAMYRMSPRGAARPLVWPRTATLARMVGADPRTAQRQLRALERAGYIRTVDEGWLLVLRDTGETVDGETAPDSDPGDNVVASGDSIVGKSPPNRRSKRQSCRREATVLSPPTFKEPNYRSVLRVESPGKVRDEAQLELVAPEPKRDIAAELWAYQHQLRTRAAAQLGRTGRRLPQELPFTASRKKAVSQALREYGEVRVRDALETCAHGAGLSERSYSYFNGVSNWRPDNVARFVANDAESLAARAPAANGRAPTRGPLLAPCANADVDESCMRPDDDERGADDLAEILDG